MRTPCPHCDGAGFIDVTGDDPEGYAISHTDGPDTEKLGEAHILLVGGSQRAAILEHYYDEMDRRDMTADEMARSFGKLESGYRARVTELAQGGYLEDTGERREGRWGGQQRVMAITPLGEAKVEAMREERR